MSGQIVSASTVTVLGAEDRGNLVRFLEGVIMFPFSKASKSALGAYATFYSKDNGNSGNRYGVQLATNFHLVLIFTFTGHVISVANFSHHHGTV